MRIYSTLKLGQFHPIFCEDFNFVRHLDENWTVMAVMDGCSAGKDTHFASVLIAKILKKITKLLPYWYLEDASFSLHSIAINELGERIAKQLFLELQKQQNDLFLEKEELVSTYILAVYHKKRKEVWFIVAGDGVVVVNKEVYDFDQKDKPDYLAYHLHTDFDVWKDRHTQIMQEKDVSNFAITTDGIHSFDHPHRAEVEINPVEYLLVDEESAEIEHMLHKKCVELERKYQLKPNDDLSVIRLINV